MTNKVIEFISARMQVAEDVSFDHSVHVAISTGYFNEYPTISFEVDKEPYVAILDTKSFTRYTFKEKYPYEHMSVCDEYHNTLSDEKFTGIQVMHDHKFPVQHVMIFAAIDETFERDDSIGNDCHEMSEVCDFLINRGVIVEIVRYDEEIAVQVSLESECNSIAEASNGSKRKYRASYRAESASDAILKIADIMTKNLVNAL